MKAMMESFNLWKLAIARMGLKTFVTGATAFTASMSGVDWEVLTTTQKVLLILGVLVVMGGTVDAFLDRTISRITEGKKPFEGDTQFIEKVKLP